MRKVIISAVALMVSASAFAQTSSRSNIKFQRYISNNISHSTSYVNDGIQGTIKVKVNFNEDSINNIDVISGIDPKIDEQLVALIKRTPSRIIQRMIDSKQGSVIVPVTFVINEN
jgi:hypothetical protein